MAGAVNAPPEHLWPTGDIPPEMLQIMRVEGGAPMVTTGPEYVPPERPVNSAELEAERAAFLRGLADGRPEPPIVEIPAGSIRAAQPSQFVNEPIAAMTYDLPLGKDRRAQVKLFGPVGKRELELLVRYLTLTSESLEDGADADRT